MNDEIKRLLELAAKAAGIVPVGVDYGVEPDGLGWGLLLACGSVWNPRDDDGDSRRLEVALGLNVDVHRQHALRETPFVEVRGYESRRLLASEAAEDNGASLEAATRLAVLLAAAAIGEAMP